MTARAMAGAKRGSGPGAKLLRAVLLIMILAGLPCFAWGQSVFPGGGGEDSSQTHKAFVTLGQSLIGITNNNDHAVYSGFHFTRSNILSGRLQDAEGGVHRTGRIIAELSDNTPSATLHYRFGGGPFFYPVEMEKTGEANEWAGDIPDDHMTIAGIQYYVVAGEGSSRALTLPYDAPSSALANMKIIATDYNIFNLPTNSYRMRGLPLVIEDASHTAVFDELGAWNPIYWRYCTYDPTEPNQYAEPGVDAIPGQGFWIIARNSKAIRVSGHSIPLDRNFVITLDHGWNQIANPFAFDIQQAWIRRAPGVGSDLFKSYDLETKDYVDVGGTAPLKAYESYWIDNKGPDGLTLTFDVLRNSLDSKALPAQPDYVPAENEAGWSIEVEAVAGDFLDRNNHFGLRTEATSDRDPFDYREPPLPPGGYIRLSFLTPENDRFVTDYRDHNSPGECWRLQLRSDKVDARFQLRFTPDRDLPSDWQVLVIDPTSLLEYDILAGDPVTGHIRSNGYQRTWHIFAGRGDYVKVERQTIQDEYNQGVTRFSLAPAFPNPFRATAGTIISLTTPHAADLTLRVYDIRGRTVKTLQTGRVMRGLTRVTWYGDDNFGQRVAAGVYFVRMQVADHNFIKKVVLLR